MNGATPISGGTAGYGPPAWPGVAAISVARTMNQALRMRSLRAGAMARMQAPERSAAQSRNSPSPAPGALLITGRNGPQMVTRRPDVLSGV
ncbi:hypothetical protein ACVIWV_002974 [Bradyrhizobium diazoefficiens]